MGCGVSVSSVRTPRPHLVYGSPLSPSDQFPCLSAPTSPSPCLSVSPSLSLGPISAVVCLLRPSTPFYPPLCLQCHCRVSVIVSSRWLSQSFVAAGCRCLFSAASSPLSPLGGFACRSSLLFFVWFVLFCVVYLVHRRPRPRGRHLPVVYPPLLPLLLSSLYIPPPIPSPLSSSGAATPIGRRVEEKQPCPRHRQLSSPVVVVVVVLFLPPPPPLPATSLGGRVGPSLIHKSFAAEDVISRCLSVSFVV